ncbi:translation initiation factor IF-2 [Reticulomyxa filosa]|uniref:Translation initiation factor IF-2 n=1 Tax=Reticulomyxa filosa TaxID=46433 RepID=X6NHG2_RETFI|nr:translation initiation factor IF-2 [Reticulomyxa filosa]|eukprot:ETO25333.1 translation initiation factor IF-2 [Reticulomyxa filosa]
MNSLFFKKTTIYDRNINKIRKISKKHTTLEYQTLDKDSKGTPHPIDFSLYENVCIQPTITRSDSSIPRSLRPFRVAKKETDDMMAMTDTNKEPRTLAFTYETESREDDTSANTNELLQKALSNDQVYDSEAYSTNGPSKPVDPSESELLGELRQSADPHNLQRGPILQHTLQGNNLFAEDDDIKPHPTAQRDSEENMLEKCQSEMKRNRLEMKARSSETEIEDTDRMLNEIYEKYNNLEEEQKWLEMDDNDDSGRERARQIDIELGKPPTIDYENRPPPDLIVLPVFGKLSDYCKLLHTSPNTLKAALQTLEIYEHDWITQDAGELVAQMIRPKTKVVLEQWSADVSSKYGTYSPEQYVRLPKRSPVLCILGHVDHGKTTFLDYLRHTRLADKEIGGITQSIGAFTVDMPRQCSHSKCIVFDTPGHAAFTGMRRRGAHAVDAAILMIDACEGIQPQTRESLALSCNKKSCHIRFHFVVYKTNVYAFIAHRIIRKERLPFVVALNKCDKPEANPTKVKQQLEALGVYSHDVDVSSNFVFSFFIFV